MSKSEIKLIAVTAVKKFIFISAEPQQKGWLLITNHLTDLETLCHEIRYFFLKKLVSASRVIFIVFNIQNDFVKLLLSCISSLTRFLKHSFWWSWTLIRFEEKNRNFVENKFVTNYVLTLSIKIRNTETTKS